MSGIPARRLGVIGLGSDGRSGGDGATGEDVGSEHIDLTVGEHTDRLAIGDAATFNGDLPHGYANPTHATTPARFTLTVYQPHVGTNTA